MAEATLDSLLRPGSVAVIGASREPGTIGYEILDNLLDHGYRGTVYPVNPHARSVHSVRAYASVSELPEVPELAVVVVPKEVVPGVVRECGEAGVGGVVVISAGFREVGGRGAELEAELLETVRGHGMRMVGPNCMGVMNTSRGLSMNATFAPTMPPRGPIAFMSQSGAMGVSILDYAAEYGFGISQFVSMGNKADVSGNDLLEHWRRDDEVGVVLMYLENFGNPRNFKRIAAETTREKPVIAVKAGRSRAGARAASSHTGALAAMDVATEALFAQCGVHRADTVEELFDLAMAFGNAPLPGGPRVAIVTNAGGPGIIIADACEARGLEVPALADATQERLRRVLPEEASVGNPVDMIASAGADDYRRVLEEVVDDGAVDAVIAAFVPPLGIDAVDVARAIRGAGEHAEKPVMAVLMGRKGLPQGMAELRDAGVPAYIFPESAARALAAMDRQRRWLERPRGEVREFPADRDRAAGILDAARAEGRELLTVDESLAVLDAYGVPVAPHRVVEDEDEAAEAAAAVGYPVVLKAVAPGLVHKTEAGAVVLELEDEDEVREAFRALRRRAEGWEEARLEGVLVQAMVEGGKETIVGMTLEPSFGPLIMFGLGGIYVEALEDVTFRLQPVRDVDAREMVRSIRGARLLQGVRGEPGVELEKVAEVVQRVSRLVGDHPGIAELDVNPFLAFPEADRCVAVDGRILLGLGRDGGREGPPRRRPPARLDARRRAAGGFEQLRAVTETPLGRPGRARCSSRERPPPPAHRRPLPKGKMAQKLRCTVPERSVCGRPLRRRHGHTEPPRVGDMESGAAPARGSSDGRGPGQGSTGQLPRRPEPGERANGRGYPDPGSILVADDNEDCRVALRALLEALGYAVYEAEDGEGAVETAREVVPDLILMDIMMPGVDGLEATRRIRSMTQLEETCIVAVTAMEGGRQASLAAGCDDCIVKPIDLEGLDDMVAGWMPDG